MNFQKWELFSGSPGSLTKRNIHNKNLGVPGASKKVISDSPGRMHCEFMVSFLALSICSFDEGSGYFQNYSVCNHIYIWATKQK